jgi:uncharacterized Tic20 family protein
VEEKPTMTSDEKRDSDEIDDGPGDSVEVEARVEVVDSTPGPADGEASVPHSPGAADVSATGMELPQDVRQMAMFCHLLGLASLVFPPFGGALGTLVLWQMKREEHPFIDEQGRSALNFNLTALAAFGVVFVVSATAMMCLMLPVAFLALPAVTIAPAVFAALAGIAANEGRNYRYPFKIEFVKSPLG